MYRKNQAGRPLENARYKPFTNLWVYTVRGPAEAFVTAPNSVPGSNKVRPDNGHDGGGIEFVTTMPLPVSTPFPAL